LGQVTQPWINCRTAVYAKDAQRLQHVLERHAKDCKCGVDCPLRMLQFVMCVHIGLQASDGIELRPWLG
jgi:hypothetical protein